MATRCNVLITYGDTSMILHRFDHGYPAVVGAALIEAVRRHQHKTATGMSIDVTDAVLYLLKLETEYALRFQLAPDYAGDIDWLYALHLPERYSEVKMGARRRLPGTNPRECLARLMRQSLPDFLLYVNAERNDCNARLRNFQRDQPGSAWDNVLPFTVIEKE